MMAQQMEDYLFVAEEATGYVLGNALALVDPESMELEISTYLPSFDTAGFRKCQIKAIENLDASFADNRPKALVQMATGAGKTFTAITAGYRLLKYGKMKRILFLVDTKSLGEQAEREFLAYRPNDDNRSFSELYGVRRLNSSYIPNDIQVCISTIQRIEQVEGKTVIMVAHRLSTVVNCDRLFFLSDGKVLASGTHRELLENCLEYRKLYGEEAAENRGNPDKKD